MRKGIVLGLLGTMLTGGGFESFAQNQPTGEPRAPGQPPRRVEPGQRRERPAADAVQRGEGLTEEQRQKVREATEKVREEQRAAADKLREARRELEQVVQAEVIDETKIRAKAQEIGKLEGDMAVLRAKQYAELRKILPKEQFERMQQPGGAGGRFGGARSAPPAERPQPAQRGQGRPNQPR